MDRGKHNPERPRPSHKNRKATPQSDDRKPQFTPEEENLLQKLVRKKFPLGPNHEVILTPELALSSLKRARKCEISFPAIRRKDSSTHIQYTEALDRFRGEVSITNPLRLPCPFEGFMRADFSGMKTNTFYKYKAALQAYAADILRKAGPGMLHTLAKKEDKDAVAAILTHNEEFNVDKNSGPPLNSLKKRPNVDKAQDPYIHYVNVDNLTLEQSIWCFEDLYDQALKAASFLHFYHPLEGERTKHMKKLGKLKKTQEATLQQINHQHVRNRKAFIAPGVFLYEPRFADAYEEISRKRASNQRLSEDDPDLKIVRKLESPHAEGISTNKEKPVKTKKKVVSELKRLDSKMGDGLEWRQRFFTSLENLPDSKREDHQKMMAVLSLTGCRPSELVKGVRVHVENSKPNSKAVALVFRVPGAKYTNLPDKEEIAIYNTLTAEEREYQEELYSDEAYQKSVEKGHEWRYMRVESEAAEALWLRDYVMREADGFGDSPADMKNMSDAEKQSFEEILEPDAAIASLTIRPDHVAEKKLDPHNPGHNKKAATNLCNWVRNHSKKLFPTIEGSVSPYCWRHQFSSDVKFFTSSFEERAQALGQVSERTQPRYGQKRSGRAPSRGGKFNSITFSTPRAVRNNFKEALTSRPNRKR